jgi:hypothetical protein
MNAHHHDASARERLSALLLAVAVTMLVFAAINAGFTPHAADLAGRVLAG